MTITPDIENLLLAGRAVFLVFSFVVAAITFTAWRRAARHQSEQILAQSDAVLQHLGALQTRLDATAAAVVQIEERLERQAQSGGTAAPGYQIAIRLAKGGASREELVSSCGLSAGEAELVRRLHGATHSAAA
jgi:hypothetical protein